MKKKNKLLLTLCLVGCVCLTRAANEGEFDEQMVMAGDSLFSIKELQNESVPLIVINTVDAEEPTFDVVESSSGLKGITNTTRVPARMCMVLGQDTIYDSGEYSEDESGLTIKIRGNSSAISPKKKPYKLKLQKKADLLCRGNNDTYKDKEWVLLTNEYKLSDHMIGFMVTKFMGCPWTPANEFVNVVMNGVYRGIYLLAESVKRNSDCRIDVDKNTGYIIEYDPYWWNEDLYFDSGYSFNYTFKYPDSDDVTTEQLEYIQETVKEVEKSLNDRTYLNYIDVPSFARWVLTHDLLGTSDGVGSNIFMSKYDSTEESLFKMETLWDFDTIEQIEDDWCKIHSYQEFYYKKLFANEDATFTREYKSQWEEKSDVVIDEIINWLNELLASNLPESIDYYSTIDKIVSEKEYSSLEDEIEVHKEWFILRKQWLDENVPSIVETGIAQVESSAEQMTKTYYNLCGQSVDSAYRGIVVTRGKKFVGR